MKRGIKFIDFYPKFRIQGFIIDLVIQFPNFEGIKQCKSIVYSKILVSLQKCIVWVYNEWALLKGGHFFLFELRSWSGGNWSWNLWSIYNPLNETFVNCVFLFFDFKAFLDKRNMFIFWNLVARFFAFRWLFDSTATKNPLPRARAVHWNSWIWGWWIPSGIPTPQSSFEFIGVGIGCPRGIVLRDRCLKKRCCRARLVGWRTRCLGLQCWAVFGRWCFSLRFWSCFEPPNWELYNELFQGIAQQLTTVLRTGTYILSYGVFSWCWLWL